MLGFDPITAVHKQKCLILFSVSQKFMLLYWNIHFLLLPYIIDYRVVLYLPQYEVYAFSLLQTTDVLSALKIRLLCHFSLINISFTIYIWSFVLLTRYAQCLLQWKTVSFCFKIIWVLLYEYLFLNKPKLTTTFNINLLNYLLPSMHLLFPFILLYCHSCCP